MNHVTDPVTVGTAVVAYVEPHAGQARAFNAWYERDHFYAAALAGPGMFAGGRWVATRACKAVRPPGTLFGDPARGAYLATYWVLPDRQAEWDDWAAREYAATPPDRRFAGRDHVHTGVYRFAGDARTDGAPAPATALDHGFAGLIEIATTGDADAVAREIVGSDVPLAMWFDADRTIMTTSAPPPHRLVLAFCATDPIEAWSRVEIAVDARDGIGFASPFLATIPGTDAYVEDL
jgi:hypothetical protein